MLAGIPGAIEKAIQISINETLRKFRTKLVANIGEEFRAGTTEIRNHTKVTDQAQQGSRTGTVSIDYGPSPIHAFKAKYTKAGTAVQPLASSPVQLFKFAFKARMKSGHVGTFGQQRDKSKVAPRSGSYSGRKINRGPRKGQFIKRTPIKELFGVPVVRVMDVKPQMLADAELLMLNIFEETLVKNVDWLMKAK